MLAKLDFELKLDASSTSLLCWDVSRVGNLEVRRVIPCLALSRSGDSSSVRDVLVSFSASIK